MKKLIFVLPLIIVVLTFTSCGPYHEQKYVDIGPNETAFVIPLEQGNKAEQKQLRSVEYLEQNKVAAKRVYIPTIQHDNGRGAGDYIWLPVDTVIKVDRSPVTREWTGDTATGTSKKDERITVESSNSIGFSVGVTVTASIPEEGASKFLYFYSGRSLSTVMDENVRSFVQTTLTREFGGRELTLCQKQRKVAFDTLRVQATKFFGERGISIDNIGAAGEFRYTEPEIQVAINSQFIAEKRKDAADNDVLAANKFAESANNIKAQKELDANINLRNSIAEAIKTGKWTWPTTFVLGQNMGIMDLFAVKNINADLSLPKTTATPVNKNITK